MYSNDPVVMEEPVTETCEKYILPPRSIQGVPQKIYEQEYEPRGWSMLRGGA